MMKKISVVLPFYNEERCIDKCLGSIILQLRRKDELIIVDDGSIDASNEKVSNFLLTSSFICKVQYIRQLHQGPAIARNFGASKSRGQILLFLDADMILGQNFIKRICLPISLGYEVGTFTQNEYVANLENTWARLWDKFTFDNDGKRTTPTNKRREFVFRAVDAAVFKKVGGYTSSGVSDDASVLRKYGKKAVAVKHAVCYHYNPASLKEVFISARWAGRDSKNKGKPILLLAFFPPWSLVKSGFKLVFEHNLRIFLFKLIYDLSFFIGLVDINIRGVHVK
jgi:glycosyltransferase involved in cell wall biosynthesis